MLALFAGMLAAFSQSQHSDSTKYKKRKLSFEEANLVSSYYHQDGNNSAITGGIGSEKLTDISNSFELKLGLTDKRERKHVFDLELGIDHYTSASSDKIDPATISSASYADTRFYPSINWSVENLQKGSTYGAGVSLSSEFDYRSLGWNVMMARKTKDRNGELSLKLQAYLDKLKVILPAELRPGYVSGQPDEESAYATASRNSFSASLGYTQIVNQRLQVALLADVVYQHGYLGLPFHRVYFNDGVVAVEKLPENRFKLPLGARVNYFLGDHLVLRSYYRYYHDSWGLDAHTASLETSVKLTPFFSVSPFYRYYTQNGVKYFAAYQAHADTQEFYTSNYDLSAYSSHFWGAGFRIMPPGGVLGISHFNMIEVRYGHYNKNNGMQANIISLNIRVK